MTNLSTVEQGIYQELLVNGVDNLYEDFSKTSKAYGIPTSEEGFLNLLIVIAEIKLKQIKTIDNIEVDQELSF